jgi:hypothetical protein
MKSYFSSSQMITGVWLALLASYAGIALAYWHGMQVLHAR